MTATTRSLAQAFAEGLSLDPASRQRGFDDAWAGLPNVPPPGGDRLAYALGRVEAEALRTPHCTNNPSVTPGSRQ